MTNPFSSPSAGDAGDDAIIIDGLNEVDTNPYWVPPGKYRVQVMDVEQKPSSNGNPMVVLGLTIEKAVDVASPDPKAVGKDLKMFLVVMPKTKWKIRKTLEALGIKCDKAQLRIQPKELVGKKAIAQVEDWVRDGETNSSVKSLYALEGK